MIRKTDTDTCFVGLENKMEDSRDVLVCAGWRTNELVGNIDESGEDFSNEVGKDVGLLSETEGTDTLERGEAACVNLARVRACQQQLYFLDETRPVAFREIMCNHIFQSMRKLHCHSPCWRTRQ